MSPTRVILLSCGSYNPPTNMHLRMFEIARDYLHRMGTHIVVGGVISPVHDNYGKKELVNSEHRCEMLKCALKNSDWIRVSTWETRQNSWTPTKLVLQHHQNLLNSVLLNSVDTTSCDLEWIPESIRNNNDRTPIQIKLLCGADLLESFGVPGLWAEEDIDAIVGQHGLVVITREGSNPNRFIYDSDILSRHMYNIYIVTEWICNEVSSTKIRRALKRGESVRYLIQDPVIDYVQCHQLYNSKTSTDSKYDNAFLTPSPSDITMTTPSPVEIISIDIAESVIKKNLINLPQSRAPTTTAAKTINTADNKEVMREKFMNFIADNGNNMSTIVSKSSYPGQAKQIIATETGESQIFREVGSHQDCGTNIKTACIDDTEINLETIKDNSSNFKCETEDNTSSENNIEIDGNVLTSISDIETIRPEIVVLDSNEASQDDAGDSKSGVSVKMDEKDIALSFSAQKIVGISDENCSLPLSISEITQDQINISLSDYVEDHIMQSRKPVTDLRSRRDETDGKYPKSIINVRKSPNHGNNLTEQVVPKMKDAKKQKPQRMNSKIFDSISPKNELIRKNHLGSLESINANKPTTLSKKSKSYEFIKVDFSLKEININEADIQSSPQKSSSSALTIVNEDQNAQHDNETIDELCSVCCYGKNQFSNKNLYTVHSNNSSPLELDSTECDLCSSYNLQDTEAVPGEPQCELCEICGDVALDMDIVASSRPETDELIDTRIFAGTQHLSLSVAKRKIATGRLEMKGKIFDSTNKEISGEDADDEIQQRSYCGERLPSTSAEEYSADDSTFDEVEFEIENCGLETEVNELLTKKSNEACEIVKTITNKQSKMINLNTELKRGNSLISRNTLRPDSKRRYSSVDSLPRSKQHIKSSVNESTKFVMKNQNKVVGSVDNIRVSKIAKNLSRIKKSTDNIDKVSQDMNKCHGEIEKKLSHGNIFESQGHMKKKKSDEKNSIKKKDGQSNEHRVGTDTIKFIIGKHGLKIISDKETSL